MATIQAISAREILDSRGIPTIECSLWLDSGVYVSTSVPSGTSKSKFEAVELRDNDAQWMMGKGVSKAVEVIQQTIGPQIIGKDPTAQAELDQLLIGLDGTPNKSKLGTNSLLAVSQAILKAGAASQGQALYAYVQHLFQSTAALTMPTCIYTVINGGEHGADNLDIQEFEIVPASNLDFLASLNLATNLFHRIEQVLIAKGAIHSTGIVGGFAPNLFNNTDAFEILSETVKTSEYTFAQDLFFGVDMAASELFEDGKYHLKDKPQPYTSQELIDYYKSMRSLYHVFYIEDPFDEEDTKSWQALTADFKNSTMVVGDSLLAMQKERVNMAISQQLCNAILIKPNQVGTITETFDVIKTARQAGWQIVFSHRSGETTDTAIADLAVGCGAEYVKFGPPNRGERVEKYNRLRQIFAEIKSTASTATTAASAQTPTQTPAEAPATTPATPTEAGATPTPSTPSAPPEPVATSQPTDTAPGASS